MLERIERLSPETCTIVCCNTSASLDYIIKDVIKKKFNVHKDYIADVDNIRGLTRAQSDSFVAPIFGDKWLIIVSIDKFTKNDIAKCMKSISSNAITLFMTEKYMNYKALITLDDYKNQGSSAIAYYTNRLDATDVSKLAILQKVKLTEEVRNSLIKSYLYEPQAVCDVMNKIKSGDEILTKSDLIEAIGVGGNSVSYLVLTMLKSKPTEKTMKRNVSNVLKLLQDLRLKNDYRSILNFMRNTVDGFVDMKTLQITGKYRRLTKNIPDYIDKNRLNRLKRYEGYILDTITMTDLLRLKLALNKSNSFDSEKVLIQSIYNYFTNYEVEE